MLPFADSPHGRLTPSIASFTRWTRRPRAGGGPLPHAARLQAGKDTCSRCRPFTAERSFHAGPRRGLARLPYLGGVAALRDFSPPRFLTLAIGDRRTVGHGWPCAWGNATPRVLPSWQAIPCPSGALALPLDGERTGRYAQERVAVQRTLPPGVERTEMVRSEPSGSAFGTFGGEWQYVSHCHSTVNVPRGASHTATRRRAYRNGTIRAEW